jgi:Predicted transcriptional regulators
MILAEKIQLLRKKKGYSQETLAELCRVSRQAISKWEADIALPETDKLLLLGNLFQVSLDVLLRDDLELDAVKEISTCGIRKLSTKEYVYKGILIKESIQEEQILDKISVDKIELWRTDGVPKYWTILYFTSGQIDFPELLSKALRADQKAGNWFADMKCGNEKIIVFYNKVIKYEIGNKEQKEQVCRECALLGIADHQMKWEE